MQMAAGQYRSALWPVISSVDVKPISLLIFSGYVRGKSQDLMSLKDMNPTICFIQWWRAFYSVFCLCLGQTTKHNLNIFFYAEDDHINAAYQYTEAALHRGNNLLLNMTSTLPPVQEKLNPKLNLPKSQWWRCIHVGVCQCLTHGAVCPQGQTFSSSDMRYSVSEPR